MDPVPLPPPSLLSRNPLAWLRVFGPGAIIASLTIGTGELVFSSRAGAIFAYDILWIFLFISLLKWALVFATARHMVLSGAHPFQRWIELPGPRGWLVIVFLLLAVVLIPIWVSFLAGVLGTLLANAEAGPSHCFWGIGAICVVVYVAWVGGYRALEIVQLLIVTLLVIGVTISLVLLHPDWLALLKGSFVPRALSYPPWIAAGYPDIAARPIWVETTTYVGVIGGASYDYLAYVSYLRSKGWGRAGLQPATAAELEEVAATSHHPVRRWLRAPLVDCSLSFAAVMLISAVFVAASAVVLHPTEQVPDKRNLLTFQQYFVEPLPWFRHLYFPAAVLAILGTLYGTVEVAPAMLRELAQALFPRLSSAKLPRLRRIAILWVGAGGAALLVWKVVEIYLGREPPHLIEWITPASLFTGVFSCGLVCMTSIWMDRRFLPQPLRMSPTLGILNAVAATVFLAIGCKAYWDGGGWLYLAILGGTFAVGIAVAAALEKLSSGK